MGADDKHSQNEGIIIDISWQVSKMNVDEIKSLILKELSSNIDKSYSYSDLFDNKNTEQLSSIENMNEDCDILWGLESRTK